MLKTFNNHYIFKKYLYNTWYYILLSMIAIWAFITINHYKERLAKEINILEQKITLLQSKNEKMRELIRLHNKKVFYNKSFQVPLQKELDRKKSYFSKIDINIKPYPLTKDRVRKVDIILTMQSIGDRPVYDFVERLENSKDCLFVVDSVDLSKKTKNIINVKMRISSMFIEKV